MPELDMQKPKAVTAGTATHMDSVAHGQNGGQCADKRTDDRNVSQAKQKRAMAEPKSAKDGAASHRRGQDRKADRTGVEYIRGNARQQLVQRPPADANRNQQH